MEGPGHCSRRNMLLWGGATAAGVLAAAIPLPAGAADASPQVPVGVPVPVDARSLELYMKLHAATSDRQVPWYYTGRIYAMRDGQAPVHLFNLEGTEIYWVEGQGPSRWLVHSSTLTFYRDRETGAYIESYRNPLTGQELKVNPNVLRSRQPTAISLDGQVLVGDAQIPWVIESHQGGGDVWLVTSRFIASAPQPWLEVQTMTGRAAEIVGAPDGCAPAMFSSSYVAPWLAWMGMGDTPGHLLWHSSGRKLASVDEMPAPYRQRAQALQPLHFQSPGGA